MMKIPFSILPQKKLYRLSKHFRGIAQKFEKKLPVIEVHLKQAESKLNAIDYISMSIASSLLMFVFLFVMSLPAIKLGAGMITVVFLTIYYLKLF